MSNVAKGTVAFSNLTEHEVYNNQSTGKFSLVIVLDEAEASKLEDLGVKLKEYEDKVQRKFASKFNVGVIDADDQPVAGEIPRGSKVNVLYKLGDDHPQHGVGTYLAKVRVTEMADSMEGGEDHPDF